LFLGDSAGDFPLSAPYGSATGIRASDTLGLVVLGAIGRSAIARGVVASDPGQGAAAATLGDAGAVPFVGATAVIAAAGTGPPTDAILALRTKMGLFRQIEDLLRVKGVGRASLMKLRPLVRLDPPPARVVDSGSDAMWSHCYTSAPSCGRSGDLRPHPHPAFFSMCSYTRSRWYTRRTSVSSSAASDALARTSVAIEAASDRPSYQHWVSLPQAGTGSPG
jgi:competence protein ComEA